MAKQIPRKKTTKKSSKQKALKVIRKRQIVNIGLTLILLFVVLTGFTIFYMNSIDKAPKRPVFITKIVSIFNINNVEETSDDSPFLTKIYEINNEIFPKPDELAATVNYEDITMPELNKRYDLFPPEYKQVISIENVLDQMIDELILLQEAKKSNIEVRDEEIDEFITTMLVQNQRTMEEFEESLESTGMTIDEAREYYMKSILLNKLLNQTIFSLIDVSDVDIQDYYYTNSEQFSVPESVNVSHILICHNESLRCVSNLTKEESLKRVEDVVLMINSTNFGALASEYSNEPGAELSHGNLGWVTKETPFDKVFLDTTFTLGVDEFTGPIETVFGFHIIKVFDSKPEELIELETVYDQINYTLTAEQQTELLLEYISGLRNESDIITYLDLVE